MTSTQHQPPLSSETKIWLDKFKDLQSALEEREVYFAESGADRELDFNADDDLIYVELSTLSM